MLACHFQVSFGKYFSKKLIRTADELVENKEGTPNTYPQIPSENICNKEDKR
jgi:hypothetical protein